MQLRSQSQKLEAVRARSSFAEPALRLKHSLQEPALRLKHSLQEPMEFLRRGASLAEPGVLSQSTLHEPGLKLQQVAVPARPSPSPSMVLKDTVVAPLGPFGTAKRIIQREGFLSLYKGLTAVWTGTFNAVLYTFVCGMYCGCSNASFCERFSWLLTTPHFHSFYRHYPQNGHSLRFV